MAIKQYILTIEESELTTELRALLENKGGELSEQGIDELDPATAKAIDEGLAAIERGERGKPWSQIREEAAERREQRQRQRR